MIEMKEEKNANTKITCKMKMERKKINEDQQHNNNILL